VPIILTISFCLEAFDFLLFETLHQHRESQYNMPFILDFISKFWYGFDSSKLPTLKTRVRYYKPLDIHKHEKPYECEFSVSAVDSARRTNIETEEHEILVRDLRGFEQHFTLEKNGFEITKHDSSLTRAAFGSRIEIENKYLDECKSLVKKRFNAADVLILGYNVRSFP
jgi:hypothetical protein